MTDKTQACPGFGVSITRREVLKALGIMTGAGMVATTIPGMIFARSPVPTSADFYVSPQGSDAWSGTLATTDGDASDGPFATLARARDAVRELKRRQPARDIVVLIREGVYTLDQTVVFVCESD